MWVLFILIVIFYLPVCAALQAIVNVEALTKWAPGIAVLMDIPFLDSNGWTQSESSVSQSLSHDDSVSSIVAHGAEVGSSRAPHFDGANR
jgi:hypothetical protein